MATFLSLDTCMDPSQAGSELQPPKEFPFPFQPYGIQKDFMRALYSTLENGCIGIFESPTGTGKSLSVICGALKWLVDCEERDRQREEQILSGNPSTSATSTQSKEDASTVPEWFKEHDVQKAQQEVQYRLKEDLQRRAKQKAKLEQLRKDHQNKWRTKRKRATETEDTAGDEGAEGREARGYPGEEEEEEEEVVLQEYHSEDESCPEPRSDSEEEIGEEYVRKIYYCSRTHSQLAQFVKEVQKSPYGGSVEVVTLGSRLNLCVNDDVTRLKALPLINDRCLEMQRNKKKSPEVKHEADGKPKGKRKRAAKSVVCPYLKPGPMHNFRDIVLARVQDIEQLVTLGREMGACPYYGVRQAVPSAQLVVLPYNTLLHGPTREAVGLKLKDSVVIIDEAHNLLDVINSVYSVEITGAHVTKTHSQLSQYLQRYKSRLKAKNLMYVHHILSILNCLMKAMGAATTDPCRPASIALPAGSTRSDVKFLRLNDFLFSTGLDHINLFKVLKYCKRSEVSKKLNGFVDRYFETAGATREAGDQGRVSTGQKDGGQMRSPLVVIESFLTALTSADKDGRIAISKAGQLTASKIKFLLLNPAVHFAPVVRESRAVVVAGGTMQPVSDFKDQLLFSVGVRPEKIIEFSCGHVIPADHLLPLVLGKGPSGVSYDFTYQSRDSTALMDELGRALLNLCHVVPGGVVCFLPSYEYEHKIFTHWTSTGCLDKINAKKKVFREPKMASQVNAVLTQYTRCIEFNANARGRLTGSLLLCVVGGKLSEGINFSDDLGRCVVMVGLPYPNAKSPELREKMEYLNSTLPRDPDGRLPGQIHYENLCMKSVNQSIGRSIRHAGDYASIVLVDHRYRRPSVHSKLPQWIASNLVICDTFGAAFSSVRKFFNERRK